MGEKGEFLIPFKGLENGIHNYRFQVSTDFFKKFEKSRVQNGKYQVDLIFDKRDQMMILDFSFEGHFNASCDRCLAMIDIPSNGDDRVIVKQNGSSSVDQNEDVVWIEDDANKIDVAPMIHTMIHLHLPLINERNCEDEDYIFCDHAVLDKIDGESAEESDKDDDSDSDSGTWDALKDLNLD